MKIIVLAHRIPYPPIKGEKIRTYHQIKDLVSAGHDITVYAPLETKQEIQYKFDLEKTLNINVVVSPLKLKWLRILNALFSRKSISASYFYTSQLQSVFNKELDSGSVDAILCTSSAMSEYVFKSSLIEGTKPQSPVLAMDFMDLDSQKWKDYASRALRPMSWLYSRESEFVRKLEERIVKYFNVCFFVSKDEQRLLTVSTPQLLSKVHSVENGVDTAAYAFQPARTRTGSFVVLFTGVMNYLPNEEAVIWFVHNIWPGVLENIPHASFVIAGMNPSSKVRNLSEIHGVQVTGYVHDIAAYYNSAHVFVAPFQFARGIQNKVLQAFSSGVPVVASPPAAEGLNAIDKEHLLVARSPQDYVKAIVELTRDASLSEKLSRQARLLVETEYSWKSKNSKLEQLLLSA